MKPPFNPTPQAELRKQANIIVLEFDEHVTPRMLERVMNAVDGVATAPISGYVAYHDGFGRISSVVPGPNMGKHYRPKP